MKFLLFCTFALISVVSCEISNDLDVNVDDIKKQLGEEFPGLDTSKFDESQLPQADELDIIFRNKCDSKSGNGTYDTVKASKDVFQECISNFVNVTELKQEVEEAKKTGSMDEVFGKYCDKFPEISKCTSEFIEAIQPCLEDNEITSLNITIGLTHKLKEFACHKNGDRIAMFVAEGGIECLSSQKEAIQQCLNSTFGSRVPQDVTPNTLPVLMFNAQDCRDFSTFRTCVGDALEHCSETTPANLVDAFFKYVKKILPCAAEDLNSSKTGEVKNNVAAVTTSFFVLVSSMVLVKLI